MEKELVGSAFLAVFIVGSTGLVISWTTAGWVAVGGVALGLLAFAIWAWRSWPKQSVEQALESGHVKRRCAATLGNEYRKIVIQAVGGLAVIVSLGVAWFELVAQRETTTKQLTIAEEGQVTERFSRAVDQLGSKNVTVRLGGIYALERIARGYKEHHWAVMEILSAYVRKQAPWPTAQEDIPATQNAEGGRAEHRRGVSVEGQAVMTVLGRRNRDHETEEQRLNLAQVDLRGVNLKDAHLEKAIFTASNLQEADLGGAHLEDADLLQADLRNANLNDAKLMSATLRFADMQGAKLYSARLAGADLCYADLRGTKLPKAHLERAILYHAHLENADLYGAHLENANLRGTHLENANLSKANLTGANLLGTYLQGAHLRDATGLVQEHIDQACMDDATTLPDGLERPPPCKSEEDGNE